VVNLQHGSVTPAGADGLGFVRTVCEFRWSHAVRSPPAQRDSRLRSGPSAV